MGELGVTLPWEDPAEVETRRWLDSTFGGGVPRLVYQQGMGELASAAGTPNASAIDLEVWISDPWSFSDNNNLGAAFYPSGEVIQGVSAVRQGAQLVFKGVPVRQGQRFIVAMDDAIPVDVMPHPKGWEPPPEEEKEGLEKYATPVLVLAFLIAFWLIFREYNRA